MKLSSCDIGNPAYEKSVRTIGGQGIAEAEIWFAGGDRSEIRSIEYEWAENPDGIHATIKKPDFREYVCGPDDAVWDITQAIEDDLGQSVQFIIWM